MTLDGDFFSFDEGLGAPLFFLIGEG